VSRVLIVGASHGIGQSLVKQLLLQRACVNFSRTSAAILIEADGSIDLELAQTANITPLQSIESQHKVDLKGIPMRMVFAG